MKSFVKSVGFGVAAATLRPSLLSRLHAGKLTVLTYHGVTDAPQPIADPCVVLIDDFRLQMQFLRKHYDVLPLDEAIDRCKSRRTRRPVMAITFDDGYQNNHDLALPILEKLGLPATIYLSTAFLDTDTTIWTGLLQHAFSVTRLRRLDWQGLQWHLGSPVARAAALQSIRDELKSLPQANLYDTIATLTQVLTDSDTVCLNVASPYRMLDAASLQRLAKSDCIELGAHTHQHFILSRLDRELQHSEIVTSKERVESLTSRRCRSFAYPNGRPEDFNDDTLAILQSCGFDFAVTTTPSLYDGASFSPLHIPRVFVHGQSPLSHFKLGLFNIPDRFRSPQ